MRELRLVRASVWTAISFVFLCVSDLFCHYTGISHDPEDLARIRLVEVVVWSFGSTACLLSNAERNGSKD